MLQEREGEHREQRVMVETEPPAAFEMVEAQLFLHLLVRLLAGPPRLDHRGERAERRLQRVIGPVVFPDPVRAFLTHQPREVAGPMPRVGGRGAIGDAHAHGGKLRAQGPARAEAPRDGPPAGGRQQLGRAATDVRRDAMHARATAGGRGAGRRHTHPRGKHLLRVRNPHGPAQTARGEGVAKRRARSVAPRILTRRPELLNAPKSTNARAWVAGRIDWMTGNRSDDLRWGDGPFSSTAPTENCLFGWSRSAMPVLPSKTVE